MASRRTGHARFPGIRLSSDDDANGGGSLPVVNQVMTRAADHQRFAAFGGHEFDPLRRVPGHVEVGEFPDVVDIDLVRVAADLTPIGKESRDELRARYAGVGSWSVRTACWCRLSAIPPNRATSAGLPSRSQRASKQVRFPDGVSFLALYFRAMSDTVERCLPARVLSMDVSMTQRSRFSR